MKKFFLTTLCVMLTSAYAFVTNAQEQKPVISFHTTIYDTYGDENDFSIVLGGTSAGIGQYIDIDCGFGSFEAQLQEGGYDTDNESATGTYVSCRVNKDGIVNIYCDDPSWIDWFNASGCYIDEIEFNGTSNIVYLDLSHNELKSLDLSGLPNLQMLYLTDNPFTDKPLEIGSKPNLAILEMNYIGALSESFDLKDYPALYTLDAWNTVGLDKLDPTGCPQLAKLSIDGTNVASLDVSKNPLLQVLNISDTRITEIDVTHNPELYQLYVTHEAEVNNGYKIKSLDLSQNPKLYYLFCTGNNLTELDVTHNPLLGSLTARKNLLTSIDVSNNPNLFCLNISDNLFGFSNLPWPYDESGNDLWTEYGYSQRALSTAKSYPVGAVIDLSDKVLRDHSDTEAFMYTTFDSDPDNVYLVDTKCYTYNNGVITLNAIPTYNDTPVDSVYVQFTNSVFSEYPLKTGNFVVKSSDEYGKPVKAFQMTTDRISGTNVKFNVGIAGASLADPKEFYVDFGDGTLVSLTTTTEGIDQTNVNGTSKASGLITVYLPDGSDITGLAIRDMGIYSINLSSLRSIRNLALTNDQLYYVDLSYNRPLESLDLSHNNLSSLSLLGYTQLFGKNMLTDVDVSYNSLSSFTWNENYTVKNLNLSHNKLSSVSFSNNTRIESIDLSYNNFTEFTVADCENLVELNMAHNSLEEITLPTTNILKKLTINDNKFTLATLPEHGDITEENYTYAPQADITIATKAPGINLSAQNYNNETVYTWKNEKGETMTGNGVDYYCEGGYTWFVNTNMGNVYCEMTNPSYPDFTGDNVLKTSLVEAAEMPNHVAATFVTRYDNSDATLTMTAAKPGTSVYIDWSGDGSLSQYVLGTTYTNFYPTTTAGATVRVYTYDETDNITVFSLRNADLESFDGSAMKQLICLNLTGAGLTNDKLILPESPNMSELILSTNLLTSYDFSKYLNLTYLNLSDNEIDEIDVTDTYYIQQLFLGGNNLKSLKFGSNTAMWSLYVNENQLTDLDITKLTNLRQLNADHNNLSSIDLSGQASNLTALLLNHNNFETIDLSPLKNLHVLEINNNNFRFSTLPVATDVFSDIQNYSYKYSEQKALDVEAVDGVVDLSSEAVINGVNTVYTWYIDELSYDDNDLITNEYLYGSDNTEGEEPEYMIENGVMTFLYPQTHIICVMTNDQFSDLTLTTNMINVAIPAGISNVAANGAKVIVSVINHDVHIAATEGAVASLYNVGGVAVANATISDGQAVIADVLPGIYIVSVDNVATKIIVR